MIRPDDPIGGWRCAELLSYPHCMWLELGVVALSIVCFVLLDLYVVGCERV
jgi:hypothetical protein